ncbi:hypothetical protein EC528_01550 [Helicobacter pylori]|uniref:hypothetical protein n=1 Tax=Helicobacter pylori TaxID=210 RepID=UPI000FDD9CE8|nr:hypothetical protein [Helicobacter pylori]RVZ16316.1 hypothetical protein EC528_01550 [Helicobacter pylori]WQW94209.1 hypothetical protein FE360_03090 [Helicobacter pylori]
MGAAVVLFLTLILLFLVLRDFGLASPKQKLVAFLIIVGVIGASISVYTYQQNQQNQQEIALQRAFLRGETLLCKGIKVNNQTFNLVSGTLSFLGKKQTPMKDVLVDLDSCQTLQKDPLIQPPMNPNEPQ